MTHFFHTTTASGAAAILSDGFKDGCGSYGTDREFSGVWLSDVPVDENEGTKGHTLLEILADADLEAFADYEWVGEGKRYREWLVPAAVLTPLIRSIKISADD